MLTLPSPKATNLADRHFPTLHLSVDMCKDLPEGVTRYAFTIPCKSTDDRLDTIKQQIRQQFNQCTSLQMVALWFGEGLYTAGSVIISIDTKRQSDHSWLIQKLQEWEVLLCAKIDMTMQNNLKPQRKG